MNNIYTIYDNFTQVGEEAPEALEAPEPLELQTRLLDVGASVTDAEEQTRMPVAVNTFNSGIVIGDEFFYGLSIEKHEHEHEH